MSHLRAPAARADRREGGRHGRPAARTAPALPETHIRPHLLRMAVLPPVAVALGACAAVLFTVRSTGARTTLVLWGVLCGAVCVAVAAVVIAAVAADRIARTVQERVGALRDGTARREEELRSLVEALRRGDAPPRRKSRGGPPHDADEFELLAADLSRAHEGAVTAVVEAARLSSRTGSEQKLEVFVNLARRLQSLVHREISLLDELENEIEDPDLLKGLFHVDHLATRIRRHSENLAVLGGAVSRRQWSNPVDMTEVLRSAIAEVEQYSRVRLVPPVDGALRGHAVADVIHLLAELVENATLFSAPHTQVLLRATTVTSGLAVEVEDRGLGMPAGEQTRMNDLLADPDQVNVARLLADGRIGLYVVSQLARRHGISVRLQSNIYGGVQAVLVLPRELLGPAPALPAASTADPAGDPAVHPGAFPEAPAPAPGPAVPGAAGPDDTGPVPLPLRRERRDRATPAAAVPGIRPADRGVLAEYAATPPTPRQAAVRTTPDKPDLPRRRAQEHLVPQLRGGPAPRQEAEAGEHAVHDPGLMAAFQRGIDLAAAAPLAGPDTRPGGPAAADGADRDARSPAPADAAATVLGADAPAPDPAAPHGAVALESTAPADGLGADAPDPESIASHGAVAPEPIAPRGAPVPQDASALTAFTEGNGRSAPRPRLPARRDGSPPAG
ncbi:sensor histidine kinase [Streptomyces sp. NRRL F-5065]|uniref:sensor histidine kinase n=1 Tax=Streptomyces sp. NRRL F-5065 TaxID=1463855 RepID=UPI00099C5383|nr:ATP-binding protein [Streptomyces sp. NRRL F-5065]